MLGAQAVLRHLLDQRLITRDTVVRGGVRIEDVSRRNRNFKVHCAGAPGYLVKQGIGAQGRATVAYEGAVYARLQVHGPVPYLPHCYGYDATARVLVLELLPNARDFRHQHTYRRRFGPAAAGALGHALGLVHRAHPAASLVDAPGLGASGAPPWILSVARPPCHVLREISEANLQLLRTIQHSAEAPALLDDLRRGWRAETLIHHDIKWDNCVLHSAGRSAARVAIIDWEGAGIGDPCWDAGSVISNYLSAWLFSIPNVGDVSPEQCLAFAHYPLERMHGAIRTFWQRYARTMRFDPATSAQCLDRATRYAAARLIQTGYEQLALLPYFTRAIAFLLQLSVNVLMRPREAVVHLLGNPLARAAVA